MPSKTKRRGAEVPCKISFFRMKTQMFFIFTLFKKIKAFSVYFLRASLPPQDYPGEKRIEM